MGRQSISLDLPDELYDRVCQIAEDTHRPLESILIDSLNLVFGTGEPGLVARLNQQSPDMPDCGNAQLPDKASSVDTASSSGR